MAIQCSIVQPTGAIAGYFVVQGCSMNSQQGTAVATLIGYSNQEHYVNNSPSLVTKNVDVSPMVSQPPVTPTSTTFGTQIVDSIEKYLLTIPEFSTGTQIANVSQVQPVSSLR